MSCCANHLSGAERCFGLLSRLYARRYRRRGLDADQRHMVEQLRSLGLEGKTLLEVGCGVGELHQTLLDRGADRAIGVDLAPAMLERARQRALERGLESRTEYALGDFVGIRAALPEVDVAILDKVVCCYPAPREMLEAARAKARQAIALTYPRRHALTRLANLAWNAFFWALRSDFRTFVHEPAAIAGWLEAMGFHRAAGRDTLMWRTELYVAR